MELEQLRKNGRIDIKEGIETGQIIIDEREDRGAREKFWFNNHTYLYKKIFFGTYEDYAEVIASKIAEALKLECAEYDIASNGEEFGVVTKNFVKESEGERIVSGKEIIEFVYEVHIKGIIDLSNKYDDLLNKFQIKSIENNNLEIESQRELLKELYKIYINSRITSLDLALLDFSSIDTLSADEIENYLSIFNTIFTDLKKMYQSDFIEKINNNSKANNLFDLWSILGIYCKYKGFPIKNGDELLKKMVDLFIYDIITSQGDRHTDNWGLIINHKKKYVKFAPIYDNSNMCYLNRSKAINALSINIDSLDKQRNAAKALRIVDRINDSIYHEKTLLKVYPEEAENGDKNPEIIADFIASSSSEVLEELKSKISLLTPEKLDEIFASIELQTKTQIPQVVKKVVITTIKTNIDTINRYLYPKEVKSNGR